MPTIKRILHKRQQLTNFRIVKNLFNSSLSKKQLYILFLLRNMEYKKELITRMNFFNYFDTNYSTNSLHWKFAKQYLTRINNSKPYIYRLNHKSKLLINSLE